jgi:hypothetical protein
MTFLTLPDSAWPSRLSRGEVCPIARGHYRAVRRSFKVTDRAWTRGIAPFFTYREAFQEARRQLPL